MRTLAMTSDAFSSRCSLEAAGMNNMKERISQNDDSESIKEKDS